MKGILVDEGEQYFTHLGKVLEGIKGKQKEYNWLISNFECYPQQNKNIEKFSNDYVWLSGEELTDIIHEEDFQWIWGVLSGFRQAISKEEVLKYEFPIAEGNEELWVNPVSLQHPLADIEIVAWDSSLMLLIAKEEEIVELMYKQFPAAKDLSKFNNT